MTKKQKKEILDSVKANVQNPITVNGVVKMREVFFVKGGWGKPKRAVDWDDMISNPIETIKRNPQLRKKFDCSNEAFELILKTPLDELLNIKNYKYNAKEIDGEG